MRAPLIPADWPYRAASQHIACKPHLWHVQALGAGPELLLIHGAGGASHSFRHLIPLLAPHFQVIAIDLPGQGFSQLGAKARCGLEPMSADLDALCRQQGWQPQAVIGHSAGAAIALRLAERRPLAAVIGINAALGKFEGLAGLFFPVMARLLAATPFVGQAFSRFAATPAQVHQLLTSTGSQIEPAGEAQYLTLLRRPSHVNATLAMMAQWQLDGLLARLPKAHTPCLLITASNDRAVPPAVSDRAAKLMPTTRRLDVPGYGHLLHEENAASVSTAILGFLAELGLLSHQSQDQSSGRDQTSQA